jgi:hypothetical protein
MIPCDVRPWEHLRREGTSFKESGRGFHFAPKAGEKAYLFASDTREFREHFSIQQSCDAVMLIETSSSRKLLFIELKGRNFEEAVDQIAEALIAVRNAVPRDCRESTEFEAIAIAGGATPDKEYRKALEKFRKRTRVKLRRKSVPQGKMCDLRELL